jgi:hypothetical protein
MAMLRVLDLDWLMDWQWVIKKEIGSGLLKGLHLVNSLVTLRG